MHNIDLSHILQLSQLILYDQSGLAERVLDLFSSRSMFQSIDFVHVFYTKRREMLRFQCTAVQTFSDHWQKNEKEKQS
jgi:hypothetical protein